MKAEIVLTKFDFTPHLLKIARERVELVLDEDSPFLELCALAGYDQDDMTLGIYTQLKHIIKILMFILLKKKRWFSCFRHWSCQVRIIFIYITLILTFIYAAVLCVLYLLTLLPWQVVQ